MFVADSQWDSRYRKYGDEKGGLMKRPSVKQRRSEGNVFFV